MKMAHRVVGRWRIVEMATWDADAFELLGPALIELNAGGTGHLRFIAVEGSIDWRPASGGDDQRAEFTWEGNDEGDPASGRGWIEANDDGSARGHIFLHLADDSSFEAVPFA